MNELEVAMSKCIKTLSVFMLDSCTTYEEKRDMQTAIEILTRQLVMTVGRRTINESKKQCQINKP